MENKSKLNLIIDPQREKYLWIYYPRLLAAIDGRKLFEEIKPHCPVRYGFYNGKFHETKRISCLIMDSSVTRRGGYYEMTTVDWSTMPIISSIRVYLTLFTGETYDYCLAHIYRKGTDKIGWHNDKEAEGTNILSASFGATRKFRFRHIGQTKGKVAEFHLGHGDVVRMLPGCQDKYEHTVPEEKRVNEWRINLTYRQISITRN